MQTSYRSSKLYNFECRCAGQGGWCRPLNGVNQMGHLTIRISSRISFYHFPYIQIFTYLHTSTTYKCMVRVSVSSEVWELLCQKYISGHLNT